MPGYLTGNPGDLRQASEIVVSSYESISPDVLPVDYPEIVYSLFIPPESMDTGVPEGDDLYSKRVKDRRGVGSFRAVGSNEVNLVGFSQGKFSVPIFNGAVGAVLDLQDIARAESAARRGLGESATTEAVETMQIASERHIERLMFFGDTILDGSAEFYYPGLINNPNVPTSTVALGASGFTQWINGADSKTPDEILYDIAIAVNTVYFTTRGILIPNEIYLPLEQYAYITTLKAGTRANDEVVWRFMSEQNVNKAINGQDIIFRPLRYLEGAGVGGTDRMMVVTKQAQNYMNAFPIPFRTLTTSQFGFLQYLFGEYKISPVGFPYPQFAGYWDGI